MLWFGPDKPSSQFAYKNMKGLNGITVKQILTGILAICIVSALSFYLELLGSRILDPAFSLSETWSIWFFTGALRTFSGAASMGILLVFAGLIPLKLKDWTKKHFVKIWSAGATLFLFMMYLLILWAL
jgi:hypothetical protein